MEDMARLAVVEQSVRDIDKFSNILYELLRHITFILENPHDFQLRTIKSNILRDFLKLDAFREYLKYVGFESKEDNVVYPNKLTLSNLRMAQVAIERKITICCGGLDKTQILIRPSPSQPVLKNKILPANVLNTNNPFLRKIEDLFNNMLQYEDPDLLAYAREQVPIVTLQVMALDRVREQQKKIKAGETKALDLPFDIALLMELMSWFKFKFFKWVDAPKCACGGDSTPLGAATRMSRGEMCRVELYECLSCGGRVSFPRYNSPRTLVTWRRGRCGEWANCFTLLCRALGYDVRYVYDVTDHVWCELYECLSCGGRVSFPRYNSPRTLVTWRRGRCGEWANCFTLLCRALGYDVRYVYDVTDHVWCEVFDYDSNTWLHCDPCEVTLNAPLMYSHGWGKKLSYVIAVSRDDVQDVTWRYTMDHKEVLKRRKECTEAELIDCLVKLRYHRQSQGSDARRMYLAKRTAQELVHLMKERKPEEGESHGRISGAEAWRKERGECGAGLEPHTFQLTEKGQYNIRYYCARDRYRISRDSIELDPVVSWARGAHHINTVFRKIEHDWKQTYLAREEGATTGEISWQFSASSELVCKQLSVKISSALYENAKITWTVTFDAEEPIVANLGETPVEFIRTFKTATVHALLSGGSGPIAWQSAQLFRQPLDADIPAFVVRINV